MFKVLLVDDEPFIIQGLSMLIDWKKEGFEIVATASNGEEALDYIKSETPDIVFADIKMPNMTGIDLLKKVYEDKISNAKFVILTGFDDFDYARSALKYKALDYLLKPIGKEELLNVLQKARNELNVGMKAKENEVVRQREEYSRRIISVLRGKADSETVAFVKKYLGDIKGVRYISFELDETSEKNATLSDEEKRLSLKALYTRLVSLVGADFRVIYDVSLRGKNYDVGVIFSEDLLKDKETENEYIESIKDKLTDSFDFDINVIVGSKVSSIEKLSDSCMGVLVANFVTGFQNNKGNGKWEVKEKGVDKAFIDELLHFVYTNDSEAIKENTKKLVSLFKASDSRLVGMVINYMMFELSHMVVKTDESIDQSETLEYLSKNAFEGVEMGSKDENLSLLLLDFADYIYQLRTNQSGGVIKQVEEDIRVNYKDNITLKELGKKYFINSAYLGQLFKNKYGISFKDYLHKIRIEKAEELLINTDLKTYEVAEAVGYKDVDYFINRFIEDKGCTPTKFRKQIKG
ncbi:MAG: response regulator [Lachnospiraceae bacterium]|nr:response regulator [Lachnospiraceae bacterium]